MPIGPSKRLRYWPPKRNQLGKCLLSSAIGNSQYGESSFAFGSGAELDWAAAFGSELVWASTSAGVVLILTKRASISRSVVLIEIAPLGISLRRRARRPSEESVQSPKNLREARRDASHMRRISKVAGAEACQP